MILVPRRFNRLRFRPAFQDGQTLVGNGLGVVEIDVGQVRERLEFQQSAIGNPGHGEIEPCQGRFDRPGSEVGIGHPTGFEIDAGDLACAVSSERSRPMR